MQEIIIGRQYKHFKGNLYKILALGKDSETCEDVIIYQSMKNGDIWVRPKRMWNEIVDENGTIRFKIID